ncbi:MAG TPA: cyclic pyranopterin monophosphate synthase MoaC [Myxococcota bacterium]|nr:cyclic pyranopterin monophosphate synthase MoaC [Myxococcota bacterium]HRY96844.1 cyclic pyranopterin monophosphate synthase MoaC [Myxococcota bacterium]
MAKLTHLDRSGRARMVDVGAKAVSARRAVAEARVRTRPEVIRLIAEGGVPKGDVLAVARLAGIQAAKRTHELIPLCHPLLLDQVSVELALEQAAVHVRAEVRCTGRTGVEMEALVAASLAALTVYDMCKAVDRGMTVEDVRLLEKSGGRSGRYLRKGTR